MTRFMFAACLFIVSAFTAPAAIAVPAMVSGEVVEVMAIQNITYMRLKTLEGEVWAAVVNEHVKKGAYLILKDVTVMKDFDSPSLKRVFPIILFGSLYKGASQGGTGIGSKLK